MNKKQMIRNKISIFLMIASILVALLSIANGWNGCEVNALADTESSEYILPNSDTDYVTEDEHHDKAKEQTKEKVNAKETSKKPVVKEESIKEEEKPSKKETKIDLNILTVTELKELAKKKEIKGYSKMKKEELIEVLK